MEYQSSSNGSPSHRSVATPNVESEVVPLHPPASHEPQEFYSRELYDPTYYVNTTPLPCLQPPVANAQHRHSINRYFCQPICIEDPLGVEALEPERRDDFINWSLGNRDSLNYGMYGAAPYPRSQDGSGIAESVALSPPSPRAQQTLPSLSEVLAALRDEPLDSDDSSLWSDWSETEAGDGVSDGLPGISSFVTRSQGTEPERSHTFENSFPDRDGLNRGHSQAGDGVSDDLPVVASFITSSQDTEPERSHTFGNSFSDRDSPNRGHSQEYYTQPRGTNAHTNEAYPGTPLPNYEGDEYIAQPRVNEPYNGVEGSRPYEPALRSANAYGAPEQRHMPNLTQELPKQSPTQTFAEAVPPFGQPGPMIAEDHESQREAERGFSSDATSYEVSDTPESPGLTVI